MDCEVCGKQIHGKGRNIIIDGAKLTVCPECTQFATSAPQAYRQQTIGAKKTPGTPRIRQRRAIRRGEITIYEDLELVENYSSLVKRARERTGLTHTDLSRKIGEKVSLLQKLETGKMVPDQALAKKLEYTLKVKLLQPASRISVEEEYIKRPSEPTLGDLVSTQLKKSGKTEEELKRE